MTRFALLLLPLIPGAQQDSLERLKDVRDRIAENKYDEALKILDEIRAATGPHRQVDTLRGMVLNRMELHHEALDVLDDVISRDPKDPDARFERGYARLECLAFEGARDDLQQALDLGFRNPGLARSLLASAEAGLGNVGRAQELLSQAQEELDGEGGAARAVQRWRDQLKDLTTRARYEGYGLRFAGGYGWTSNALRLDEEVAGVPGVASRKSSFFSLRLVGWYDVVSEPETVVRFSGAPEYRFYDRAHGLSYFSLPVRGEVSHAIDDDVIGRFGLRWQPTWLFSPDRRLNTTYSVSPSVTWLEADWARITFGGEIGFTRYAIGGLAGPQDADSTFWGVSVEQTFDLDDEKRWSLSPSIGYRRNSASGSDYDSGAVDAGLAVQCRATDDLRFAGGLQLAWTWYDNPQSLSATLSHRRDTHVFPYAQVTYDATDWLSFTLTASYLNAGSTLTLYDYRATDVSAIVGIDVIRLVDDSDEE